MICSASESEVASLDSRGVLRRAIEGRDPWNCIGEEEMEIGNCKGYTSRYCAEGAKKK